MKEQTMAAAVKHRRINFFIVGYWLAFFLLALTGYYMSEAKVAKTYHNFLTNGYFATDLAMYDLPRINMDLTTDDGGRKTRVRMDISLEVAKKDMLRIEGYKPRITDRIIMYMHSQNFEGVSPPEVMRRLHENLLSVIAASSEPVAVHDIIFRQFVVL